MSDTPTTSPAFPSIPEDGEAQFLGWVNGHAADDVLGDSCETESCPLAHWWSQMTGYPVHVGTTQHYQNEASFWLDEGPENPTWVQDTVEEVDDFGLRNEGEITKAVFLDKIWPRVLERRVKKQEETEHAGN